MSSVKWRPFCPGVDALNYLGNGKGIDICGDTKVEAFMRTAGKRENNCTYAGMEM